MTPLRGSDLHLSIRLSVAPPVMEPISGLRVTAVEVTGEVVDIGSGSSGRWSRALSGAGTRNVKIKASGLFLGTAAELQLRALGLDGRAGFFALQMEAGRRIEGEFIVERLEYHANHDEELCTEVTLASSGPIALS